MDRARRRLTIDTLDVATFDPAPIPAAGRRGTVQAHEAAAWAPTNGNTCRTCQTNCLPYC